MVKEERIMTQERPYFLNNKDWFYFDEKEWKYKLTDKATNEAKESYKRFYDEFKKENER